MAIQAVETANTDLQISQLQVPEAATPFDVITLGNDQRRAALAIQAIFDVGTLTDNNKPGVTIDIPPRDGSSGTEKITLEVTVNGETDVAINAYDAAGTLIATTPYEVLETPLSVTDGDFQIGYAEPATINDNEMSDHIQGALDTFLANYLGEIKNNSDEDIAFNRGFSVAEIARKALQEGKGDLMNGETVYYPLNIGSDASKRFVTLELRRVESNGEVNVLVSLHNGIVGPENSLDPVSAQYIRRGTEESAEPIQILRLADVTFRELEISHDGSDKPILLRDTIDVNHETAGGWRHPTLGVNRMFGNPEGAPIDGFEIMDSVLNAALYDVLEIPIAP